MTLRKEDIKEAKALGLYPHRGVFFAYRYACYRRTALINGEVAAMWGLHGELLGSIGHPYLITGVAVTKISPITFARIYLEEVKEMSKFFPNLENYVDASYSGAVRMLKIAGFSFEGPFDTPKGDKFLKFKLETI